MFSFFFALVVFGVPFRGGDVVFQGPYDSEEDSFDEEEDDSGNDSGDVGGEDEIEVEDGEDGEDGNAEGWEAGYLAAWDDDVEHEVNVAVNDVEDGLGLEDSDSDWDANPPVISYLEVLRTRYPNWPDTN